MELVSTIMNKRPALSLDQVITAQLDEPAKCQRNCIYTIAQKNQRTKTENRYTQIRVKSIDFLEMSATAIYFYDMTHYFETLKLEGEVQEQKNRHAELVNYQVKIT